VRMIPTSGAGKSEAPQITKGCELVSRKNISSRRKGSTARKTPHKTSKRGASRRKAA
jgi:hypothetical protein